MAIITVEQCSKIYFNGCISRSKLYDMVRKGQMPILNLYSRKIYFDTNALDRWVDNGCVMREVSEYGKLRELRAN